MKPQIRAAAAPFGSRSARGPPNPASKNRTFACPGGGRWKTTPDEVGARRRGGRPGDGGGRRGGREGKRVGRQLVQRAGPTGGAYRLCRSPAVSLYTTAAAAATGLLVLRVRVVWSSRQNACEKGQKANAHVPLPFFFCFFKSRSFHLTQQELSVDHVPLSTGQIGFEIFRFRLYIRSHDPFYLEFF
jgi:hypothetical protein